MGVVRKRVAAAILGIAVVGGTVAVATGSDAEVDGVGVSVSVETTTTEEREADTTVPPTTVPRTTVPKTTTTTTPETTTTVVETTTTVVETTTTVVETTVPTTVAPVPVAPPPPQPAAPIPPPKDARAQEAVIELGSIEIPRLQVAETMYEGIRLTTLDRGPGHWPGTAMPGAAGNVVVAGHRTSHSRPFRHLELLEPGDEVIFNTADGRFVYLVTGTEIVQPDAIHIINQTPESTATLFACHPPGSTKQRIVIYLALSTG